MSIAQSFYTVLTANSAIDALVSNRIFPHQIPQEVTLRPCLTFDQVYSTLLNPTGSKGSHCRPLKFECF